MKTEHKVSLTLFILSMIFNVENPFIAKTYIPGHRGYWIDPELMKYDIAKISTPTFISYFYPLIMGIISVVFFVLCLFSLSDDE